MVKLHKRFFLLSFTILKKLYAKVLKRIIIFVVILELFVYIKTLNVVEHHLVLIEEQRLAVNLNSNIIADKKHVFNLISHFAPIKKTNFSTIMSLSHLEVTNMTLLHNVEMLANVV